MAHKSVHPVSTQIYGLLSVVVLAVGIIVNLVLRPDAFAGAIPYSLYGTLSETKYIFSSSLILAGLLLLYEAHYISAKWRRWACYIIMVGFTIIALVPINNGYRTDLLHGLGTFLALVGLLISLWMGIALRRPFLSVSKWIIYILLLGIGLSSAAISILSGGRIGLLALQGYAEYSGLLVYAGWVLLDFGDQLVKNKR